MKPQIKKSKTDDVQWEEIKKKIPSKIMVDYHDSLKIVFLGNLNPISKIQFDEKSKKIMQISTREEGIDQIIANVLIKIAKNYIGRKGIEKENLQTCCLFVRRNFSNLSPSELIYAFEFAFSGKIDVDMNLYGNEFSAGYVGKVLSEYKIYRSKILKKLQLFTSPKNNLSETEEKDKVQKNKAARKQMIFKIIDCYKKYWKGKLYKIPIGLIQLLEKLDYKVIDQQGGNKNEFLEKLKQRVKSSDSNRGLDIESITSSYDNVINHFFAGMKEDNLSPKEFGKEIQQRLKNYETNLSNQINQRTNGKFR